MDEFYRRKIIRYLLLLPHTHGIRMNGQVVGRAGQGKTFVQTVS